MGVMPAVPLGGPIGDVDGQHAVLVVRAGSEDEARAMFADDPWMDSILRIESVEPWTLWVGAEGSRHLETVRRSQPSTGRPAEPSASAAARRVVRSGARQLRSDA